MHNQNTIPLGLFRANDGEVSENLQRVPHNGTRTSIEAAESIASVRDGQQSAIVFALTASPNGLTREELEDATGMSGNAVRPRCWELVRGGAVVERGERKTRSGRMACVLFVATNPEGRPTP